MLFDLAFPAIFLVRQALARYASYESIREVAQRVEGLPGYKS